MPKRVNHVNKVSSLTKKSIRNKSVMSLPPKPSSSGYSAEQIKRAFTLPILDSANSTLGEIDRLADEINGNADEINDALDAQDLNISDVTSRQAELEDFISRTVAELNGIIAEKTQLIDDKIAEFRNILAPTLEIAGVDTLPAGSDATVENVGTPKNASLLIGIPKGDKGEAAVISDISAEAVSWDAQASAENVGTVYNAVIRLKIPSGKPAAVTVNRTFTVDPESPANVVPTYDGNDVALDFYIPQGKGFKIEKIYASVAAMNAAFEQDAGEVPLHGFVLIDTGNVNDDENARLYIRTATRYRYLVDLSGAQGIQGPRGYSISGAVFHETAANGDRVYKIFNSNGEDVGDIIVPKGDTGTGIAGFTPDGQDADGGNIYKVMGDNGAVLGSIVAPKGEGGNTTPLFFNGIPTISNLEQGTLNLSIFNKIPIVGELFNIIFKHDPLGSTNYGTYIGIAEVINVDDVNVKATISIAKYTKIAEPANSSHLYQHNITIDGEYSTSIYFNFINDKKTKYTTISTLASALNGKIIPATGYYCFGQNISQKFIVFAITRSYYELRPYTLGFSTGYGYDYNSGHTLSSNNASVTDEIIQLI